MSNKCKGAWHFPYFTGHIVQHAICTWRKHFLINENSHIESYLSYFLKNKPWLTFFSNQNFSAYFWDYFFMYFLVLFVASQLVNFSCAFFNIILSYFRISLFPNVAIFSQKYGTCRISANSKENFSAK